MMQGFSDQTDVIRLFSDPTTYGGEAVQRIDTHASGVFLAGSCGDSREDQCHCRSTAIFS